MKKDGIVIIELILVGVDIYNANCRKKKKKNIFGIEKKISPPPNK